MVLFQGFEDSFDQFVRNQFSFTPESENIVQRWNKQQALPSILNVQGPIFYLVVYGLHFMISNQHN